MNVERRTVFDCFEQSSSLLKHDTAVEMFRWSVGTLTLSVLINHLIPSFLAVAACNAPLVLTQDGQCINILIDFNNCGGVGIVCGSEFTSCSAGVCSTAPAVQLSNPRIIWLSALNGGIDDSTFLVPLPFSITLYGVTVGRVTVTTNGVSDSS